MKRMIAIITIVAVTILTVPLTGVAYASTTGSETGTVTACKCPPGNHYGHCNSNGKHKGHHKNGEDCESHM